MWVTTDASKVMFACQWMTCVVEKRKLNVKEPYLWAKFAFYGDGKMMSGVYYQLLNGLWMAKIEFMNFKHFKFTFLMSNCENSTKQHAYIVSQFQNILATFVLLTKSN